MIDTATSMRRRRMWFWLALLGLVLGSDVVPAMAQTLVEREALAAALNAAMLLDGNDTTISFTSEWQVRDVMGGCLDFDTQDVLTIEKQGAANFELRTTVTPSHSDGTISVDSHPIICDFDALVYRCFTTAVSDTGNASGTNFEYSCSSGVSSLSYWMIDEALPGVETNIDTLSFFPGINYHTYSYPVTQTSGESTVSTPGGALLMDASSLRWLVRRFPGQGSDPDTLIAKRAHGLLRFDWSYYDLDPTTSFISKSGVNKLVSLEFLVTVPTPSPDACPDLFDSYGTTTEIELILTYDDGASQKTAARTIPFSGATAVEDLWDNLSYGMNFGVFDIDSEGFPYLTFNDGTKDITAYLPKMRSQQVAAEECSMQFPLDPNNNGFDVDPMTGDLVFVHGATSIATANPNEGDVVERVYCLEPCEKLSGTQTATNVLSASAQTYDSKWSYDPAVDGGWSGDGTFDPNTDSPYYARSANRFQRGADGKWRVAKSFVYRSSLKPGIGGTNPVYDDAGVFTNDAGNTLNAFTQFVWGDDDAQQAVAWLNPTTVRQYAPSGEAVEEVNVLDIPSSAKLAHNNTVPLLVAQNAEYRAVSFTSFEEDPLGGAYQDSCAHAGRTSYFLPRDTTTTTDDTLGLVTIDDQVKLYGLIVKFWLKRTYNDTAVVPVEVSFEGGPYRSAPSAGVGTLEPGVLHDVAQTGAWSLYELLIDPGSISSDTGTAVVLEMRNLLDGDSVWIDDVRIQPTEAQMICYVYDRFNLRLLAQFDDQHFGRYYRYNGEGKLIRTLVETERGLKTVAETYYHTPQVPRVETQGGGGSSPMLSSLDDRSIARRSTVLSTTTREIRAQQRRALNNGDGASSGVAQQFDLMGFEFGPNGPMVSVLGSDGVDLATIDSFFTATWERIRTIDADSLETLLPNVDPDERHDRLESLLDLDRQLTHLKETVADETLSTEVRERARRELEELRQDRTSLLRDDMKLDAGETLQLYDALDIDPAQALNAHQSKNDHGR